MAMEKITSLGYGGLGLNDKLPKVLAELQGLTISGPLTGGASGSAIAVTDGIDIQDSILKVMEYTAGVPSDVTSVTTIVDRRATGTITLSGIVAADVVSVNGKAYTFATIANNPSTDIPAHKAAVGTTDTISATNLANAINAGDSTLIASATGAVVTIFNRVAGTGGNSVALAVTASNGHATRSNTTLLGGTATNAIKIAADTTGNLVVLTWYKKSRLVGQA